MLVPSIRRRLTFPKNQQSELQPKGCDCFNNWMVATTARFRERGVDAMGSSANLWMVMKG